MASIEIKTAKKLLTLDLSPEAYSLLQKLSDKTGKNRAETLRTGLALYGINQGSSEEGLSLDSIIDDEKIVKEIILT